MQPSRPTAHPFTHPRGGARARLLPGFPGSKTSQISPARAPNRSQNETSSEPRGGKAKKNAQNPERRSPPAISFANLSYKRAQPWQLDASSPPLRAHPRSHRSTRNLPSFLRETIRQGGERGKRSHGRCQVGNAGRRVPHPGAPVDGLRRRRAGSHRPGPRPQVHRHGQPVQVSSHLLPSLAALDLLSLLVFVPWGGGSVLFLAQFLWILSAGLTSLPLFGSVVALQFHGNRREG